MRVNLTSGPEKGCGSVPGMCQFSRYPGELYGFVRDMSGQWKSPQNSAFEMK